MVNFTATGVLQPLLVEQCQALFASYWVYMPYKIYF